ncbi:hypothetical protein IJ117_00785 [Candidatus Saccharibacteria bacterium]|nr:hypothetical protein [Candidatus Saccharibacteria bacterium]
MANNPFGNSKKGSTTTTPALTDVQSNEENKAAIDKLEAAVQELKSRPGQIPDEVIVEFGAIKADFAALAKRMVDFDAKLRAASKKTIDKPVLVYRYVDSEGNEGFVPDTEENAQLKAIRLDGDGLIEMGYAYVAKETGKYIGFQRIKLVDGSDPGRR